MCSENSASYQCLTFKPCQGVVQICEHTKNYENTHHLRILEVVKKFRWLVFDMRVTFIEHNLSIIGAFVEHNRKIFGAVQHSIIATFLSIIGSALLVLPAVMCMYVMYVYPWWCQDCVCFSRRGRSTRAGCSRPPSPSYRVSARALVTIHMYSTWYMYM